MKIIRQPVALAAVSELRTGLDGILAQLRKSSVTLEKHNKEVAILEDPQRYAEMQAALEAATDVLLAFEARKREKSGGRYVPLEEVEKRFL